MTVVLILLILISIYLITVSPSGFSENIDDIIGYQYTDSDIKFVNAVKAVKNPIEQIHVSRYGCFKDIDEKFFIRKINPFSAIKTFDSAYVISSENDFSRLLSKITTNGFGEYSTFIKSKYTDYKNISVQELGSIALFAGYSYISICKESPDGNLQIYFSYSPPMTKHNITGQFTPKDYIKYLAKPVSNDPKCGYSCGNGSSDYCGSITYPNIKSPSMYSVYSVNLGSS